MPLDDPNAWAQGAQAFKSVFEGLRSAIGLVKELRASGGGSDAQNRLVDEALDQASEAAKIAEAQVAQALGYELCKCEFPPIPMLTVGHHAERGGGRKGPVFECPKCGYNTAGPWMYQRLAPERKGAASEE